MIGRGGETRVVTVTDADPVLFSVARTPTRLGRPLLPADAAPGAEPVMVLTHRTWEVAFASSPAVVDRVVPINGVGTRIVGVMPPGFGFPVAQDIWLPLPATDAATAPSVDGVSLFARLAPGATPAQAAAEASTVLQSIAAARRPSAPGTVVHAMSVESFPAAQIGEERTVVFTALNAAAGLILLLSLVNVTTLLTARANERVRETAVRLAFGASTGRLVVQGLWETVILCLAGGVAGTAAAAWGLDAITRWTRANMEGNLAFWWVWQMDRVTIASAGAFVTVAIAVLGAIVSMRALRTNVRDVLQDGSARGRIAARRPARPRARRHAGDDRDGADVRGRAVRRGRAPRGVARPRLRPGPRAAGRSDAAGRALRGRDARDAVFRDVEAWLAQDGALSGVLLRQRLAARDSGGTFAVRTADPNAASAPAHVLATLGAMSTLGIDLVQGRALAVSDDRRQAPVAAISRSLAARQWPGRSPLGEQLRLSGRGDAEPWRTIVGVVSDVPYGNPFGRDRSAEAIYVPLLQAGVTDTDVIVRYRTSEVAGRQALHQVFGAIDPQMVPGFVFRASEVIEKSGLITVGLAKLFGACFAFALLLALAGTYGLMSASIGLRTREIGVRRALGATEAMATRMLLTQGARQLGVGTLIAAPVLLAIGVAATQLFPLGGALTAAAGVLVSAAIVAMVLATTWLPTRRVLSVPLRDAIWKE